MIARSQMRHAGEPKTRSILKTSAATDWPDFLLKTNDERNLSLRWFSDTDFLIR